MNELQLYIVSAVISGVISGMLTACIQPVVDNWLSHALKNNRYLRAVKISLAAVIFAVSSCVIFVLVFSFMIRHIVNKGESSLDDNSNTTITIESTTVSTTTTTESTSATTPEMTTTIIEVSTTIYEKPSNNFDIIYDCVQSDMLNIVAEQGTASPGEIIQYHVRLINNPGFSFDKITIEYDHPIIEYSRKNYEEVSHYTAQDGFLYSYEYQIPSTAKSGEIYNIHISLENVKDINGELIPYNVVDGYILII